MSDATVTVPTSRSPLPGGDESGSAPGDRLFRPDVHGLRAVAVLLVVFFHAGGSFARGGFVGVDVFFVISGFVITGVLLRDSASGHRPSIVAFYGRRARRIIPAASVVIISTVVAAYVVLGVLSGNRTALDGRWAAVFLVNVHFAAEGTNYLGSQQIPSPLQNFWSLSVEEQFYLVYPALFLAIVTVRSRIPRRTRLAVGLGVVVVASFTLSIVQTASDPTVAFFSPWTRACELALGGLMAVGTPIFLNLHPRTAAVMTWAGLGVILLAGGLYTNQTAYPGWLVSVPVIGAALIIAGGTSVPRAGAERLLGMGALQWLGGRSYSLYLWHWPILIIAAESRNQADLSFPVNLCLLVVALAVSVITYAGIENPIRHARRLRSQRWTCVVLGLVLTLVTLGTTTVLLDGHAGSPAPPFQGRGIVPGSPAQVADLVAASTRIQRIPADAVPSLLASAHDFGAPHGPCTPAVSQTTVPGCMFGDLHGRRTMVLYGDSHALMWFRAIDAIAEQAHWRLVLLGKGYCMANQYPPDVQEIPILGSCARWQTFADRRIRQLRPDLVVVTQEYQNGPGRVPYTGEQWQRALEETLSKIRGPHTKFIVLGNIPDADASPADCLARNPMDVQACSVPNTNKNKIYDAAEKAAVNAFDGRYISVRKWFCSRRCSPIIGRYFVYVNGLHVTASYATYLERVLADGLRLTQ
jgi:peptidoglycan/LPS O-acetylase OafA/YrhL